ncbi:MULTISPECIES: ABC transporter permease [Staphylococcus]|uniref:ABC transporter permease n=1 Tax=Staphylococcus agnetis TaxID=985762 RepID=A0A2T4MTM3_9STAP|nr:MULTISPECIES: ABC transporter permease [Staphylococcus]ALN76144.1 ABC transporter permease [Staphylococcus agnetis]KFE41878.1 spermidine/putrescine ABC transporter permease PotC [Staphylococcus agnetis]MBY7665604.1 ABC transporter permease [Staphylococcus agnetis]MCO4327139.1 ABC transporter permease [Staphylococcus agnetis]MCO4338083.1 ABC transporter permease [Staphylococcus agnetis]
MKWIGKSYLIGLLIVLYLPIFYLMFYSFNSEGNMVHFGGFTLEHYVTLFNNKRLLEVVFNTIAVALIAAAISTIIGVFGALMLYQIRNQSLKISFLTLNNVLMVSSDVVIGASFLIMFTAIGHVTGFGLGFTSVLVSHIAFCIPIVVIIVLPKLYEMNESILDAGRDLGASDFQVLSRIVIPQLMPGIIGGFFMALTYSLDDFTVSFFVTGNGFSVLSVEVYSMARRGISMEINAISTILFLIIMLGLVIYQWLKKHNQRTMNHKREMTL